ncbi:MAG: DUF4920 domain-containing protein [Saprospiraceae bacterium]|nr:DUF4920 domain-containing protein [Saprospiraceae bacterium]
MLKKLILGLGVVALFAACTASKNKQEATALKDGKHFGAMVTTKDAITYDQLIPKMAKVDSMPAKVTGEVVAVCQKKGCWMTLQSAQPGKPEMRVTFKDYAFFMPKDLSGKKVVVDGFARVEVTPVEVLRHFAQDAGKTAEEIAQITEPKRELTFEAAGVLVLD